MIEIQNDYIIIKNEFIFKKIIDNDISIQKIENILVNIFEMETNKIESSNIIEGISNEITKNIKEVYAKNISDNVLNEIKNIMNESINKDINSVINNIPIIMKGIFTNDISNTEILKNKIDIISNNITNLYDIKNQNDNMNNNIKDIMSYVIKQKYNINTKGESAENEIYDLLCNSLRYRDGFSIERTNTISQSCDILIKKNKYPNIRLEVKAYGKDNGRKVPVCEVNKFKRDLEVNNDHGIMISLYSDIYGLKSHDIEILNNNKIALYLSNTDSIDIILDSIYLIYKLNTLMPDVNDQKSILSIEKITEIKDYINNYIKKIQDIKTGLNNVIKLVGDLDLVKIKSIIEGDIDIKESVKCIFCNKTFANPTNRKIHEEKCKNNGNTLTLNNKQIDNFFKK